MWRKKLDEQSQKHDKALAQLTEELKAQCACEIEEVRR